ncbi:MAG: hypothetical protein RIS94_3434, partial [Pseudomonadota bacterium]
AIIGITEAARGELAALNIGISAFCPGPVQSNIAASGELRPADKKQDTGYLKREEELEQRPVSPLWMSQDEVGERVLAGIRANDLYILTHPEFADDFREIYEASLAALPDEEAPPARLHIERLRREAIKAAQEGQIIRLDDLT